MCENGGRPPAGRQHLYLAVKFTEYNVRPLLAVFMTMSHLYKFCESASGQAGASRTMVIKKVFRTALVHIF